MNDLICQAINEKRLLKFDYHGKTRIVEPHTFGVNKASNDILSAYQVGGQSDSGVQNWKLFLLDNVLNITILDDIFDGPESGYVRDDKRMARLYCQL